MKPASILRLILAECRTPGRWLWMGGVVLPCMLAALMWANSQAVWAQPDPLETDPLAGDDPAVAQPPAADQPADAPPAAEQPAGDLPPEPPKRLIELEPFDLVKLLDGTEVKVLATSFKTRSIPKDVKPKDELIVRLVDKPTEQYRVTWENVVSVTFYEELLMQEAEQLAAKGDFELAWDNLQYLETNRKTFPGVKEATNRFIFRDAEDNRNRGKLDLALALLDELYARDNAFAGLADSFAAIAKVQFDAAYMANDFRQTRALLAGLESKFPDHPQAVAFRRQLTQDVNASLKQSQQAWDNQDLRQAHTAATRAIGILPDHPKARQMFLELSRIYPRVTVGVTSLAEPQPQPRIDNMASRRLSRLMQRSLMEFSGYGAEGGSYVGPFVVSEFTELNKDLILHVKPDIYLAGSDNVVTGYDVARLLRGMCDPANPVYNPEWAHLLKQVTVRNVNEVLVELNRTHVRAEALLQVNLQPASAGFGALKQSTNGPYMFDSQTEGTSVWLAHPGYFIKPSLDASGKPTHIRPQEIIEKYYKDSRQGMDALLRGDIQVLDRLAPWEAAELEQESLQDTIAVVRYGTPTLHCLLPNPSHPLLSQRIFRRAIAYGINRQAILDKRLRVPKFDSVVTAQARYDNTKVISGPFPRGRGIEDPLGYAYAPDVEPYVAEPQMAMTLGRVSLKLAQKNAEKEGNPNSTQFTDYPELVLAHPPTPVATVACAGIAAQLTALKFKIKLQEMPANPTAEEYSKYDLVYLELSMYEPLVDARKLLGRGGVVLKPNPYIEQHLRSLETAQGWEEARKLLQEIHHRTAEDLPIIPLWQMDEYFAHHKSISNVGEAPITLYQEVEQWKIEPIPLQ